MKVLAELSKNYYGRYVLFTDNTIQPYVICSDFNGDFEKPDWNGGTYFNDMVGLSAYILDMQPIKDFDLANSHYWNILKNVQIKSTVEYLLDNPDLFGITDEEKAIDIATEVRELMQDCDDDYPWTESEAIDEVLKNRN